MENTETPPETDDAPAPSPHAVSRRDFLKRASKDAVQTGAAFVPGAAVAKAVLGGENKDGTRKPSLAERWAEWKNARTAPSETTSESQTGSESADGEPKQ